jgi:hypothetical protein
MVSTWVAKRYRAYQGLDTLLIIEKKITAKTVKTGVNVAFSRMAVAA